MQFQKSGLAMAIVLAFNAPAFGDEAGLAIVIDIQTPKSVHTDPVASKRVSTSDTATLLADQPGVSLNSGGGVSSLPAIHGMADDRIKLLVDGMQLTSACANHMNPALSYAAPATVAGIGVSSGLTPVSMGGDSIAGTISVSSPDPLFAEPGQLRTSGSLSTFYRSVNSGSTLAAKAGIASDKLSLEYAGAQDKASSYQDGHGNLVRDTLYKSTNQQLTLATRGDGSLLKLKAGLQSIPYQGFPSQYMDMVDNRGKSLNADYRGDYDWGVLDTRVFWQDTRHGMGFFTPEKTGSMPMNTHGKDVGYALKADVAMSEAHTLRVGNEFHGFTLNDWWPPVPGSMMMGPATYLNINNGRREVMSVYAEMESHSEGPWGSVLGVRAESVSMDTGNVQSYGCGMMCAADTAAATAFNAANHVRRDSNFDLTAVAKYDADRSSSYEFGFTRKTRSPNLYERYTWGRSQMAMNMTGWFGDANGYVGNLDLNPEVASTIGASVKLRGEESGELAVHAYYTRVQNYIGVNLLGTYVSGGSTLANFQFANHDAKIYGLDLSGKAGLWDNSSGTGEFQFVAGWTRGMRLDTGGSLYHIMPFNTKLTLAHTLNAWHSALEVQYVANKTNVDLLRNEPATPGYTLVNIRSAYEMEYVRFDFGIDNLFNKFYYLPLGGMAYADWKAANKVGQIGPLPGMGRSINAGLTVKF